MKQHLRQTIQKEEETIVRWTVQKKEWDNITTKTTWWKGENITSDTLLRGEIEALTGDYLQKDEKMLRDSLSREQRKHYLFLNGGVFDSSGGGVGLWRSFGKLEIFLKLEINILATTSEKWVSKKYD